MKSSAFACTLVVVIACADDESAGGSSDAGGSSSAGDTASGSSPSSSGAGGELSGAGTTTGGGQSGTGIGGSGAGGSAGNGEGASDEGGSGGQAAACTLQASGPIAATADGQVFENLHIVSTAGAAVTVEGFADVVIRNCLVEHQGGPGISFVDAPNLHIEQVAVVHTGAPPSGANDSDDRNNIDGYGSSNARIDHVRLERGSSGVYLVECASPALSFVEGHDFRGPFPRGQLAQFNNSNGAILEDFSVVNPPGSWPEDNVNVYQSFDVTIRRGLVDGNNSPSGVGVIFDGDAALGIVEDVDAVRMGNGCFSDYAGSEGVVFRRTRCRDNICEDQGRGLPSSNALMWCGHPGYTEIRLEDSQYFAACNPDNLVWPDESFAVVQLEAADFVPRAPVTLSFCWE